MRVELRDYDLTEYLKNKNLVVLNNLYIFYKEGYKNLREVLIDEEMNFDDFWNIVCKYYITNLFDDEITTLKTCDKLDIKPKTLMTNFISYKKEYFNEESTYFFQNWIVLETGKFDGRKVYNEKEIEELINTKQIVPLFIGSTRPANNKLKREDNNITYEGKHIANEELLDPTYSYIDPITYYKDWENENYCDPLENEIIQDKVRKTLFYREKVLADLYYYRFRALEILGVIRQELINSNPDMDKIVEHERLVLK